MRFTLARLNSKFVSCRDGFLPFWTKRYRNFRRSGVSQLPHQKNVSILYERHSIIIAFKPKSMVFVLLNRELLTPPWLAVSRFKREVIFTWTHCCFVQLSMSIPCVVSVFLCAFAQSGTRGSGWSHSAADAAIIGYFISIEATRTPADS